MLTKIAFVGVNGTLWGSIKIKSDKSGVNMQGLLGQQPRQGLERTNGQLERWDEGSRSIFYFCSDSL